MATMEITVHDYKMVINGEQVGASDGQTMNVINPANGQLVGTAPKGSVADVEKAVAAARAAGPG
jgi:acyl-CoA reductase-like NAD-dependent aldehyde dehydrogenase